MLELHAYALDSERRPEAGDPDNVAALLEAWNAKGLTTAEAIEAHLAQVRALNRRIRELMDLCGHRGG